MKSRLRMDGIVIDGTSLTRREREHLARALERELARQLRWRAAGQRGPAGSGARRGRDADGASALGARIADDVLAALPGGILVGTRTARLVPPGRRRSRPAMLGEAR